MPFDLIAFDGDDTLWHNERSYREARDRFRRLLAGCGVSLSEDEIEARVNTTEISNIEYYGYAVAPGSDLLPALNAHLKEMTDSGTLYTLFRRQLGDKAVEMMNLIQKK